MKRAELKHRDGNNSSLHRRHLPITPRVNITGRGGFDLERDSRP